MEDNRTQIIVCKNTYMTLAKRFLKEMCELMHMRHKRALHVFQGPKKQY